MSQNQWKDRLAEREKNQRWLEDRFYDLDYPGLYLGDEMNTFHFDWDRAIRENRIGEHFRIALMNLCTSQLTFAAPAVMLFYEQLHAYDASWVVERSFCPPTANNQKRMAEDGIRPFAVESKMPLTAFDALCLSMDITETAVSVPWLILESGIPLQAGDRGQEDPFVILGGAALVNPGPFTPFCDIFFFGEGEEILPQLLALLEAGKKQGRPREESLLEAACRWDCLYVPRFYEDRYSADGRFEGTVRRNDRVPEHVRYYRAEDLDQIFLPRRPFHSFCYKEGYLSYYEISRGCEGKCSFCMGGYTTLPFRARSARLVREAMDDIRYETGSIVMTPVSFNMVSYPELNQIIRDYSREKGNQIRAISVRMDGFYANPELCCFISTQQRGRVVFGVEGSSQRLRDLVSKNLTEEQILNTMHAVCRLGYGTVKFMMICNLPTETDADLDELYELAVKIHRIFEEETEPGKKPPKLLLTWQPLKICPHTPLQWTEISTALRPDYAAFEARIRELGFSTFTPKVSADEWIAQLILRADSRLSALLAYLAGEGDLRHEDPYGQEVLEKTIRFLEENGLPPLEAWFRELRFEDPLPWDIVESPAGKDYLYARYRAMREAHPKPVPICSTRCSGCGACSPQQRKRLAQMPAEREKDRKIGLSHPAPEESFRPDQFVLLEYEYDHLHSVVLPSYWNCELRRALFQAGILFDPASVKSFGSEDSSMQGASGFDATCISLGKRYDPEQLKRMIQEHAVNFRVKSIAEIEKPLRVTTATYRLKLPEGTDEARLQERLQNCLAEEKWDAEVKDPTVVFPVKRNPRPAVRKLEIRDGFLQITMGPKVTNPLWVYGYVFSIPASQPIHRIPERIGYTYENQGILDRALNRETRDAFLASLAGKEDLDARAFQDMAEYIASSSCEYDLKRLIRREYWRLDPFNGRAPEKKSESKSDLNVWKRAVAALLELIRFAAEGEAETCRDPEANDGEDPAYQAFKEYLRENPVQI